MLLRAGLLFVLVAAITAGAILKLVQLPEIALLRYVVLATPLVGAAVVVVAWHDHGGSGSDEAGSRRSMTQVR